MSNESPARILYDEAGNRVGVGTNPVQVTGYVRVDSVGVTGPIGPVGITGPVRVDSVGITGYVQATGPIGVTGLVGVVGAVGGTGPFRVDSVGGTGPFRVDSVGVTGPVRVDSVGITGYVQATGPVGVTGLVSVVGAVGGTGPFRVDSVGITGPVGPVGITGYVQATGPIGVTGLVSVVGAVGGTGPFRVDSVGGTGPFRVDSVGVTGPVRVDSVGGTGPFRVDSVGGTGPFRVDSVGVTGPVHVDGFGSAGTPTGGILSVQGVSGAQPQPVVGAVPNGVTLAGNPVTVAGSDGTTARTLRTDTDGTIVFTPRDDRGNVGTFGFGGDDRLRVGMESLLFFDTFEGTTINNVLWMQSTSGMTQAQASSAITLNNGNSTTNGNYSIFTSTKNIFLTSEFPVYVQFKARLIPQTNAVIEIGFGTAATTAAPTNGCFIRIDSAGVMRAVINFGGTETTSAALGTLTSANYYSFEVVIHEDSVRVDIDNADGSSFASTEIPIPATQAAPMTVSHIPIFARVYNSGTPGAAANVIISGVSVQQLDLAMVATWEEQMAGTGRGATADPQTGAQLQNFANSAAPSTIAAASLSNTTPAYTTLGGLFAFNTPAGAETDYLLFAYQIPDGFTAMIWTVQIGCVILGAQSSTSPTVLEWGIAVGSSAASLATGAPNPPVRQTMGFQQAPKTASVGDSFDPANLTYSPRVPLVCFGGKYVQIIVRVVSGNLTAGQINRGFVNIDGFFQ